MDVYEVSQSILRIVGEFPPKKILSAQRFVYCIKNRTFMSHLFSTDLGSNMAVSQAKLASVLNSPLWKPVFRHQISPELELEANWPTHQHQDGKKVFILLSPFCLCGNLWLVTLSYKHCVFVLSPLWDCELLEAEAAIVIFIPQPVYNRGLNTMSGHKCETNDC